MNPEIPYTREMNPTTERVITLMRRTDMLELDKITLFTKYTGKSKSSYFRYKKRLERGESIYCLPLPKMSHEVVGFLRQSDHSPDDTALENTPDSENPKSQFEATLPLNKETDISVEKTRKTPLRANDLLAIEAEFHSILLRDDLTETEKMQVACQQFGFGRATYFRYRQKLANGNTLLARAADYRRTAYTENQCYFCGFSRGVHIHHINHDHGDDRPENRVTLCGSCHRKIHRLSSEQPKLRYLIQEEEKVE